MTPPDDERKPPADWAVVTGPTPDAKGARIVRFRGDEVQAGEVRPAADGAPLTAGQELVRMKPIGASGVPAFEVESIYRQPAVEPAPRKGPAQVANDTYRSNWDRVFAAPKPQPEGPPN
jgi:hypothetical protein